MEDIIVVLSQSERLFEQALKKESGYIVRKMKKDGACLFRAVGKNLKVKIYIHEKVIHCVEHIKWNTLTLTLTIKINVKC